MPITRSRDSIADHSITQSPIGCWLHLIELTIVIAILVVLAGIGMAQYRGSLIPRARRC